MSRLVTIVAVGLLAVGFATAAFRREKVHYITIAKVVETQPAARIQYSDVYTSHKTSEGKGKLGTTYPGFPSVKPSSFQVLLFEEGGKDELHRQVMSISGTYIVGHALEHVRSWCEASPFLAPDGWQVVKKEVAVADGTVLIQPSSRGLPHIDIHIAQICDDEKWFIYTLTRINDE